MKPNIIYFFTDQQRFDTVGVYGQKLPITPNLDALAKEGTKFTCAFTCQPVCGPARSCLQTGLYATQTGCYRNDVALPNGRKTIANLLKESGYKTAYVGKWHLASTKGESNEDLGERFDYAVKPVPKALRGGYEDYWVVSDVLEATSHGYDGHLFDINNNRVDFTGYRADKVTDFALDFLKEQTAEEPFFLFLSHIEPHHQNDHHRYEGPEGSKTRFAEYEVPGDLAGTDGDWKENYPDYLGSCERLDYNLGRIVSLLKEKGLYENTVIIYTSDHGSHFRTRNNEYKRSCHDASIRIPCIIKGKGFDGGKVINDVVSLIDIPPTILSAAGAEVPNDLAGVPLQKVVEGTGSHEDFVFFQISESEVGRGIRTAKYKYSVRALDKDGWRDSHAEVYNEMFLYDLVNDPYEKNNLVADPAYEEVREQLSNILIKKMTDIGEKKPLILPYGVKL